MKKKKIIIPIIAFLVVVIGIGIYFAMTKQDKKTTLTVFDKQWIESHKNTLFDIEIETNVPIFNYNGQGVFFDFLTDFEKNIGIEFNKVPKKNDDEKKYSFSIVSKAGKDDIVIYKDNYVIVSKNEKKYAALSEISNITVGVLESELENANKYLKGSKNISLKTFEDVNSLLDSLNLADKDEQTNAIIILKTLNMDNILKNNLYINYNLSDYTNDYVLTLGSEDKLNSIIKKYYNKWQDENYNKSFQDNFTNNYFLFEGITDKEKTGFKSKRYVYGFVSNEPYDLVLDNNLIGINASILRDFSKLAGIKIEFNEYENNEELVKKFNENKVDLFFNSTSYDKYDMDVINTLSNFDEKAVYLTNINNNIIVNSVNSLENYEVKTIKNSKIHNFLEKNNIKVKLYNNIEKLIDNINDSDIIAIDKETYNYYVRTKLSNYRVLFEDTLDSEYYFTLRDISDNDVFNKFFSFYLSFIDEKDNLNDSYSKLVNTKSRKSIIWDVVVYTLAFIGVIYIISILTKLVLKIKNRKNKLTKEQKIKYVDMLTSLKNRNYLNDNIEKWDNSEVYPQTIIVIDLNNVAYINDNYGHQEGDNLIKEAANILIKTQVSNTEIIRTNGNEFLIYMVGYDEKQVISYIRKLNKEFKELAHGFGAAVGYSIINDAIKTIDDAVNEATIDMRNNKEEVHN